MPPSPKPNLFIYTPPTPYERFSQDPISFVAKWLYTHQPPITAPCPSNHPIKVVCISDTHTGTPTLPHGDILIHAGDLTTNGTFPELQLQITWLSALPHEHKIVIAGNHDLLLDEACYAQHAGIFRGGKEGQRKTDLKWGDVVYLEGEATSVRVRGRTVMIWGSPMTMRMGNWAFQYARSSSAQTVWKNRVPESTEILITHGPAKGHLDGEQVGCEALLKELWRVKPRVRVHGHIHAGRGTEVLDWVCVQWCYERVVGGERGVRGVALLCVAVCVWIWSWFAFAVCRRKRRGRTVVVNVAWEGNAEKSVTVVEI